MGIECDAGCVGGCEQGKLTQREISQDWEHKLVDSFKHKRAGCAHAYVKLKAFIVESGKPHVYSQERCGNAASHKNF